MSASVAPVGRGQGCAARWRRRGAPGGRSSRARPRSQAASMPRQRPSASHQVAWASPAGAPGARLATRLPGAGRPSAGAGRASSRGRPAAMAHPAGEQVGRRRPRAGSSSSSRAVNPAGPLSAARPDCPALPRSGSAAGPARPGAGPPGGPLLAPETGARASALRVLAPRPRVAVPRRRPEPRRTATRPAARPSRGPARSPPPPASALAQGNPRGPAPPASRTVILLTASSASKTPSWSNRGAPPWAVVKGGRAAVGRSPRAWCRFGAFLADVRVLQVLPARRVQDFGRGA